MIPSWWHRVIRPGDKGPDVDVVRRKLGLPPGEYDHSVRAMIHGIRPSSAGLVDSEIAELLGETEVRLLGILPEWYVDEIGPGSQPSEAIRHAHRAFGLVEGPEWTRALGDEVRRFRSSHGLPLSDVIDSDVARMLTSR